MNNSRQQTLIGTRDFEQFTMKYFRTEKQNGEESAYGVRLEKHISGKLEDSCEIMLTNDIEHIDRIIDRLIGGSVTVVGLMDIIDFIYDEAI